MEQKFNAIEKLILVIIGVLVISIVGGMDYRDEKNSELYYCKNVVQWELDKQRGIDPYDRTGWPASSEERRQRCLQMAGGAK